MSNNSNQHSPPQEQDILVLNANNTNIHINPLSNDINMNSPRDKVSSKPLEYTIYTYNSYI